MSCDVDTVHLKLVDWALLVPGENSIYETGQYTSPVDILPFIDKINNIFIQVDIVRQSLYPSNIFCKIEDFN